MTWVEGLVEALWFLLDIVTGGERKKTEPYDESIYMPLMRMEDLPDSARAWVFGADYTLDQSASDFLLREVDHFLSQWHAHGEPLTVARDFRYGRFLTVAVDQSTAGASGCSIDGLFRTLKALEPRLGRSLVTSGLIFFRDRKGEIQSVDRERFVALGEEGKIPADTTVFDPTVTSLGEWRARFELKLPDSWHAKLLRKTQPA